MSKKYKLANSRIHGKGVFSDKDLDEGEKVGRLVNEHDMLVQLLKLHKKDSRTELGKFVNHNERPNCKFQRDKDNLWWYLVTTKDIKKDRELTINYINTPWFVDKTLTF